MSAGWEARGWRTRTSSLRAGPVLLMCSIARRTAALSLPAYLDVCMRQAPAAVLHVLLLGGGLKIFMGTAVSK